MTLFLYNWPVKATILLTATYLVVSVSSLYTLDHFYSPPLLSPSSASSCLFISVVLLSCRYWDKEVQKAKKEGRVPHLTKAIILCYWKPYLVLGFFTLIEVIDHKICVLQVTFQGDGQSFLSWLKQVPLPFLDFSFNLTSPVQYNSNNLELLITCGTWS